MAPVKGPFFSIVPMTVTLLDDHRALSAILVPTTVKAAVMSVVAILSSRPTELTARPVIAISMHTPVAANTNYVEARDPFGTRVRFTQ